MECQFVVGQKVICVSDDFASGPEGHVLLTPIVIPVKGQVYTIRSIEIGLIKGNPCLRLEEIEDQTADVLVDGSIWECGIIFDASDFRPLVNRPTDISIFTDILKTQRTRIDA